MNTLSKETRSVKVGIIQMQSIPLDIDTNLSHAAQLISDACIDGAQLVVLPEFFSIGYSYSKDVMKLAEDKITGKTVSWLKQQASKYNIHILTSFYEVENGNYFNTMVMVEPNNHVQYSRKMNPFWQEFSLFQQSDSCGPGIFDTELGRIGGIICFDAFSREAYENLKNNDVDMVAIVACWGIPRLMPEHPSLKYPKKMLEDFAYLATEVIPKRYALDLNVPVIHVGQGGVSYTPVPVPKYWPFSKPIVKCDSDFWGHSQVRNSDGSKLLEADKPEFVGVVSIDVHVTKKDQEIRCTKIDASYLSNKKYIIQPPSFMAKVTQEWCWRGFKSEYN